MARTSNTASIINLLAGIWLIISPFILDYASLGVSATNAVIVGIVVGIFSLIKLANYEVNWPAWLNFLLGVWLIVSPFANGNGSIETVATNEVILGIIVIAFSLTSAFSSSSRIQMQT